MPSVPSSVGIMAFNERVTLSKLLVLRPLSCQYSHPSHCSSLEYARSPGHLISAGFSAREATAFTP